MKQLRRIFNDSTVIEIDSRLSDRLGSLAQLIAITEFEDNDGGLVAIIHVEKRFPSEIKIRRGIVTLPRHILLEGHDASRCQASRRLAMSLDWICSDILSEASETIPRHN